MQKKEELKMSTKYEVTIRQLDIRSAKALAAMLKAVLYKLEGESLRFLVYVDEDWDEEAQEKVPAVLVQATVIQSVNYNGYVAPFVDEIEGDDDA